MPYLKLAGRGKIGDRNWGADFTTPKAELEKQLKEIKKHIGKEVLLTGGGGHSGSLHILQDVWIQHVGRSNSWGLMVRLTPGLFEDTEEFTPFLDSWQISIKEESCSQK